MTIMATRRAAILGTTAIAGATVLSACVGEAQRVKTPDTGEKKLSSDVTHPIPDELVLPTEENPLNERGGILVGKDLLTGEVIPDVPVVRVYGDYLCPYCATFSTTHEEDLAALVAAGEVTLEFHNMAFVHEYSLYAAAMSLAASVQFPEQWWDFHTALFEQQPTGQDANSQPTLSHLYGIAESVGLDSVSRDALTSDDWLSPVMKITEMSNEDGVTSTPTVMVDGVIIEPEVMMEPGSIRALVRGEE